MVAAAFIGISILSGIVAIVVALIIFYQVKNADEGSDRMREVSALVEEGAYSFIKVQYRVLTAFTIILAILIVILFVDFGIQISISYFLGSMASMSAGYVGIVVATDLGLPSKSRSELGL